IVHRLSAPHPGPPVHTSPDEHTDAGACMQIRPTLRKRLCRKTAGNNCLPSAASGLNGGLEVVTPCGNRRCPEVSKAVTGTLRLSTQAPVARRREQRTRYAEGPAQEPVQQRSLARPPCLFTLTSPSLRECGSVLDQPSKPRLTDSSEDKCNMNKNSAVDCTKAFVDELELAGKGGRSGLCEVTMALAATHGAAPGPEEEMRGSLEDTGVIRSPQ
ncbi:hypothetical protein JOQ06_003594, partial [Pogonophryne albipinna]